MELKAHVLLLLDLEDDNVNDEKRDGDEEENKKLDSDKEKIDNF